MQYQCSTIAVYRCRTRAVPVSYTVYQSGTSVLPVPGNPPDKFLQGASVPGVRRARRLVSDRLGRSGRVGRGGAGWGGSGGSCRAGRVVWGRSGRVGSGWPAQTSSRPKVIFSKDLCLKKHLGPGAGVGGHNSGSLQNVFALRPPRGGFSHVCRGLYSSNSATSWMSAQRRFFARKSSFVGPTVLFLFPEVCQVWPHSGRTRSETHHMWSNCGLARFRPNFVESERDSYDNGASSVRFGQLRANLDRTPTSVAFCPNLAHFDQLGTCADIAPLQPTLANFGRRRADLGPVSPQFDWFPAGRRMDIQLLLDSSRSHVLATPCAPFRAMQSRADRRDSSPRCHMAATCWT